MSQTLARPLRIGYLVPPSPHFAGIERVVHELATGLQARHPAEFEVTVLYCNRYTELLREPLRYEMVVLEVDQLRYLTGALRRAVSARRLDVLICAQIEPSVIAWLATRGLGLKHFVAHMHGNPQIEYVRGSIRTRFAFEVFRKLLARRLSAVFCVSQELAEHVRAWLHEPALEVLYAPNPIRTSMSAARTTKPAASQVRRFVNVGRLSKQKGQDVLLAAFARAAAAEPNLRLTIVGTGEDERDLQELSRSLGVDGSVEFTGYLPDASMLMADSDCFVLSSRWEGLPGVLLEALELGLPVIATRCQFGTVEVIESDAIGLLVDVEDSIGLSEAMLRMARTPQTAESTETRRAVARRYSTEPVLNQHRELLLGLDRKSG